MYTDIPEWSDYLQWWGTIIFYMVAGAGVAGGVLYLIHIL